MSEANQDVAATLLLPERKGATFITEVSAALNDRICELGHVVHNISTSGRHLARFDLAGAQIVVAYCGAPVSPAEYRRYLRPAKRETYSDNEAVAQLSVHRACIILSAKPKELPGFPAPLMSEIEALMHQLITGLRESINISLVLWGQTGMLYTEGEFAQVAARAAAAQQVYPVRERVEALVGAEMAETSVTANGQPATERPDVETGAPDAVVAGAIRATGPSLFEQNVMDICRLHDRLDGSLAQIRRIKPKPQPKFRGEPDELDPMLVANDTPDLPAPKLSEAERVRAALYPEDLEEATAPRDRSLPHRLSIYTLNTSLLIVALPVGAAMLTYNALGRESLTATARAAAITGVGIFYSQLPIAQKMLALIL
jgi:hypothetical protein